ncbi:agpat9 [Nucleospora cyclopteri]
MQSFTVKMKFNKHFYFFNLFVFQLITLLITYYRAIKKIKPPMRKRNFLNDAIEIVAMGTHSLESDDLSKCFIPVVINETRSYLVSIISIIIRYLIIAPFRLCVFFLFFAIISVFFVFATHFNIKWLMNLSFLFFMKLFAFTLGVKAIHSGEKYKISDPHIYVANHTTFLDFVILSSYKFPHAVISENHGGLFGFLFNFIIRRNGSICFSRSDRRDRKMVKEKIYEHLKKKAAPMLVFPEGTCVNNKYSVLFQKSSFEMNVKVVPVAIKYKKVLTNPYWNRRRKNFAYHLFYLLTRWRTDVEVFWMAPSKLLQGENPIGFSHRIKKLISEKANLINSPWNGYFKSCLPHADVDMLKYSMLNVLSFLREGTYMEDRIKNIKERKEYLNEYTLEKTDTNEKIYFNCTNKKQFLHEVLKEYLRTKSLSTIEKETLIISEDFNLLNKPVKSKIINCNCSNSH